jgi:ABC-type transport system involved in Fe-S cluster assembly fused permease/ATPase subunit
VISENLETFGKSKTQVIIAHRLSTVKNADQIIFFRATVPKLNMLFL